MSDEPDTRFESDAAGEVLPRPALPPTLAERVQALLDRSGMTSRRALALGAGAVVVVIAGWWLLRPPPTPIDSGLPRNTAPAGSASASGSGDDEATTALLPAPTSTTAPSALVVHAAGAVAHPGLYRVRAGARVADVIDAAGGLAPGADGDRINLAEPVADGERVYILRVGEAAVPEAVEGDVPPATSAAGGATSPPAGPAEPVDLNTATADQLDALPGVGPSTAQAIIAYRMAHGRFTTVDDLLNVRGIGPAKLAELRPQARV